MYAHAIGKRAGAFVLAAALVLLAIFPMTAAASGGAVTHAMQGSGTAQEPYLVATTADLDAVRQQPDAHYRLVANLVFAEADYAEGGPFYDYGTKPTVGLSAPYGFGFEPIGSAAEPFTGTFDGDGHSITNYYAWTDTSYWLWIGLFGYVDGAVIENLHMVDADVYAMSNTNIDTGAIAGFATNSTIRDCTVTGTIVGDNHTGAVVGRIDDTSVLEHCINYATVTARDSDYQGLGEGSATEILYVGGIVGQSTGAVRDCENGGAVSVQIEGNSMSYGYAGGVVGALLGGTVETSTNHDTVTAGLRDTAQGAARAPSVIAGGVVGLTQGAVVQAVANHGTVSAVADSSAYAGGIVGYDQWVKDVPASEISAAHNAGAVSSQSYSDVYAGGIVSSLSGSVTGSYNTATVTTNVTSSDRFIYGEVGGIVGNSTGFVSTCYNTGAVNVSGAAGADSDSKYLRTGGIVGRTFNGRGVQNCYNTGDITVQNGTGSNTDVYTGGLVGMMDNTNVSEGYSFSTITTPGRASGGVGIIASESSTFANAYTNGGNYIVGTVGSGMSAAEYTGYTWRLADEADRQNAASYVGFDFDGVWTMAGDADYLYPELAQFHTDAGATLTRIELVSAPSKTLYARGEPLELGGGVIRLVYNDGSTLVQNMSADTITGFDSNSVGTQTLTISIDGQTTTFVVEVTTANDVLKDNLDDVLATLPQVDVYTDEQKIEVKNLVAQAVQMLYRAGKESLRNDEEVFSRLLLLEQALIKAEPLLSVTAQVPTVDADVSADTALPAIGVEIEGLILSAHGGGGSGTPDPIFSQTEFALQVSQTVPTQEQRGIVLDIWPSVGGAKVENFNLTTPVRFKLYLNEAFAGDTAYITHEIIESNQYPTNEEYQLPVLNDAQGKYISVTATRFSTFRISDTPPPPTAFVTGTIKSANSALHTTVTLYATDDTDYSDPIAVGNVSSDGLLWGEQRFSIEAEYATYHLLIEQEGHLGHVVTDVVVGESGAQIAGALMLLPGDVNDDDKINFSDLAAIRNSDNFGKNIWGNVENPPASEPVADLNGDGMVNVYDLQVVQTGGGYNKAGRLVTPYMAP